MNPIAKRDAEAWLTANLTPGGALPDTVCEYLRDTFRELKEVAEMNEQLRRALDEAHEHAAAGESRAAVRVEDTERRLTMLENRIEVLERGCA